MTDNREPHRLLKFDLICRCAILATALTTSELGTFVQASLTAKLIIATGAYGTVTLLAFSVCVILALLDVLINDFMPERFSLRWVKQHRHLIYLTLAGLYIAQAFVALGDRLDIQDFFALSYCRAGIVTAWYALATSARGTHVEK